MRTEYRGGANGVPWWVRTEYRGGCKRVLLVLIKIEYGVPGMGGRMEHSKWSEHGVPRMG